MSNTEFKWTVDLLAEFIRDYGDLDGVVADLMEQFKESKQPKPEWEIMSYRHKMTKEIAPKGSIGFCKAMYNNSHEIYSIKRLSDDQLFTIADKVTANAGCDLTILKFDHTGDNRIRVHTKEYGYWFLDDIKKVKKILFVTEDGVSICYNDKFFYVDKNYEIREYWADSVWTKGVDGIEFSKKEKAEEYILNNKPLLSLADLVNIGYTKTDLLVNKAKQKLNKS